MTRDEANAKAAALSAEHPERDRFRWVARQDDGAQWSVVRFALPKPQAQEHLTMSQQGKQATPPEEHPTDLPGGVSPWAAGGG